MNNKTTRYSLEWIRKRFEHFFIMHGHQVLPSSSLIPHNDPSLLFTNAGMNQFKSVFLGSQPPPYPAITTVQRCLRAGGKHNDLDNVGYTDRHHTFFEMLGHFSFGCYFKKEAIIYAWSFLTDPAWLGINPQNLWITVYEEDQESYKIWKETVGVPADRILKLGDSSEGRYCSDNFWQMGNIGPCGPCTEIFYDYGSSYAGGPPGSAEEGDRFIEIWNLVFMQFDRQEDGSMRSLPTPCVDTGMGLERIAALLQGVHSNYEIDFFCKLIEQIALKLNIPPDTSAPSFRVLADHIRASIFLLGEGVIPTNEGRGYVLRRIIRRAIRHGQKLGATAPFLYTLVEGVITLMGSSASFLQRQRKVISTLLKREEHLFFSTLTRGVQLLAQTVKAEDSLDGKTAFKLYDTYGFPFDLTELICAEQGIKIDREGFDIEMEKQRARGRKEGVFRTSASVEAIRQDATVFLGYDTLESEVILTHCFRGSERVLSLEGEGAILLDKTPFYAECGGQVGDTGLLLTETGLFQVEQTQRHGQAIIHYGRVLRGVLHQGQLVHASVDALRRADLRLHHSATHLLHAALRSILREGVVTQQGSLVMPTFLRFDFSYPHALQRSELEEIEKKVNTIIRMQLPVTTQLCSVEEAKAQGALAQFDGYDAQARMVSMGEFSKELCGGTHVSNTGEIGYFRLCSEFSIASGVRRIEASAGDAALQLAQQDRRQLLLLSTVLRAPLDKLCSQVEVLMKKTQAQSVQNKRLGEQIVDQAMEHWICSAHKLLCGSVVVECLGVELMVDLKKATMQLQQRLGPSLLLLCCFDEGILHVSARVTETFHSLVSASTLIERVVALWGGKGGGHAVYAQARIPMKKALPAEEVALLRTQVLQCLQ